MPRDIRKVIPVDVAGDLLDLALSGEAVAAAGAIVSALGSPAQAGEAAAATAGKATEATLGQVRTSVQGTEGISQAILTELLDKLDGADFVSRVGDPGAPAAGTLLSRLELLRALQDRMVGVVEANGTANALNGVALGPVDVADHPYVTLRIGGAFVATYVFEGSNDGVNWTFVFLTRPNISNSARIEVGTVTGVFASGFVPFRHFRVRLSAYTSGTVEVYATFHRKPVSDPLDHSQFGNRFPTGVTPADGLTNAITTTRHMAALMGYNGATWDRIRTGQSGADGVNTGQLATALYGWNGAAWDRLRANGGDGASTGLLGSGAYAFNGVTWDRVRGSIANGLLVDVSRILDTGIQLPVDIQGVLRGEHQSTTTPLAAGASYISAGEDVLAFGRLMGTVFASHDGTLYIDQSPDNVNWDHSESLTVSAGVARGFSVNLLSQYVRVRYVNGATLQTAFRLRTFKAAL